MSLSINSNISAMNALRRLNSSNSLLSRSLEKLSTGLKINQGADDPAGLIISENLRAEIRGLNQAVENTGRATDLVATAEGALDEVSNLLRDVRELILHAVNTGGNDPGELEADQLQIDNALAAIDRIANSTRYGSKNILDGSQALQITAQSGAFSDIVIRQVGFGTATSATIDAMITQTALRACASVGSVGSTGISLRITGTNGTRVFDFASGQSESDIAAAVNVFTADLGVFVGSTVGGGLSFLSTEFGSDAFVSVALVDGNSADYVTAETNSNTAVGSFATGRDISATVGGQTGSGDGIKVAVSSSLFTGEVTFSSTAKSSANAESGPNTFAVSATIHQFTVRNTGLTFQIGSETDPSEQVVLGIESVHSSYLGTATIDGLTTGQNGRLSSIGSGGDNDLRTDPNTALNVVDNAISDVSNMRGFLGAFQRNVLETNLNSLGIAVENLTASESRIRDVDFAAETTEFTRTQILVQAGTSMLAQANLQAQSILQLLG